ncbi:hypothetical protein WA026_023219 [Henosepilachna vigintioctopunctata]|uniref:Uncharacterized protein n=1 Tax=Henosepilachna vigintioctopunctata TaxID=420089 RepID=A0AAW1VBF7_9CUCU
MFDSYSRVKQWCELRKRQNENEQNNLSVNELSVNSPIMQVLPGPVLAMIHGPSLEIRCGPIVATMHGPVLSFQILAMAGPSPVYKIGPKICKIGPSLGYFGPVILS